METKDIYREGYYSRVEPGMKPGKVAIYRARVEGVSFALIPVGEAVDHIQTEADGWQGPLKCVVMAGGPLLL